MLCQRPCSAPTFLPAFASTFPTSAPTPFFILQEEIIDTGSSTALDATIGAMIGGLLFLVIYGVYVSINRKFRSSSSPERYDAHDIPQMIQESNSTTGRRTEKFSNETAFTSSRFAIEEHIISSNDTFSYINPAYRFACRFEANQIPEELPEENQPERHSRLSSVQQGLWAFPPSIFKPSSYYGRYMAREKGSIPGLESIEDHI